MEKHIHLNNIGMEEFACCNNAAAINRQNTLVQRTFPWTILRFYTEPYSQLHLRIRALCKRQNCYANAQSRRNSFSD